MSDASEPVPVPPSPSVEPAASTAPVADPTRRGFLAAATCALAACAGAGSLGPVLLAVISPARGGIVRLGEGTIDLGPLEQFDEMRPLKVAIHGARTDAFLELPDRALGSVLVVRRGDRVEVFSAVCPHAGCEVLPRDKERDFFCPCHDSSFALDGQLSSGPSPRGLDSLETSIDGGRVEGHVRVRFERFQVGTSDRRAV